MGKHKGKKHDEAAAEPGEPMSRKEYERELKRLHGEVVALQEWVKASGTKICVLFEGRDTAGKGGTIKAITDRVSPRTFRVVALPAPTERERSQMYVQRYITHLPAAGEVVIFDRSWYNRAGVERVMGFCSDHQADRFLEVVPAVEQAMVDSGIVLVKYWLEVVEQHEHEEEEHEDGAGVDEHLQRRHEGRAEQHEQHGEAEEHYHHAHRRLDRVRVGDDDDGEAHRQQREDGEDGDFHRRCS